MGNQPSDERNTFSRSYSLDDVHGGRIKSDTVTGPLQNETPGISQCLKNFRIRACSASSTDRRKSQSPSLLRKARMKQIREQRPKLSSAQIKIVLATWCILKEHVDDLGADVFNRYIFNIFVIKVRMRIIFQLFASIRIKKCVYQIKHEIPQDLSCAVLYVVVIFRKYEICRLNSKLI